MIKSPLPYLSLILILFIAACSTSTSKNSNEDEEKKIDPKRDSLLLVFDTKNNNKKLDAYFNEIHRKRNYNGNVLIAKKRKNNI